MTNQIEPDRLKDKQALVSQINAWAHIAILIGLGIRLGLFSALSTMGSVSAATLANKTGLNERLLLEWLRSQVAAGVLQHESNDLFNISPETASLLADQDSLTFAGTPFMALPARYKSIDLLANAFQTGIGYGWDDLGSDYVAATERARRNWFRQELIPTALPMLQGVIEKLTAGAKVADVGCGAGVALLEMAARFEASEFHGYEISKLSLQRAGELRDRDGVRGAFFHNSSVEPLPEDASFDLVMTLDCLHDMTHPEVVTKSIREALKPDGTWFILDFDCEPTFEQNLARGAVQAASGYATSVLLCLPSSMSEDGGVGLGTLGLPEPAMRELVTRAGFSRFKRIDAPGRWALYESRP